MGDTDGDDDAFAETLSEREHDDGAAARRAARPLSAPTVDIGPIDGGRDRPRVTVPAPVRTPFEVGDGRFEARGELGRGGMGRVDDAFDRALGRAVAIKHLLSASETGLARFAREARLTARLEHPGVVPIHDVGYGPDGAPYYVMRRVDGRPLAELVERTSLAARLALIPNLLAACDAVAFAHARGIVHRDIKPANILVGRFGETLVIDWGLARELEHDANASGSALPTTDDEALTVAGSVAGTPGFMAPEQARGEAVDARADVFALGATLFFVLSGELLYAAASATELVSLAGAGRSPNWSALPAGVAADLRAIVVKAVASDAAERYADAGALAADLRRFVTGNLVAAHQYGAFARLVRFVRRHRTTVAIAAAAVIVLALVGGFSVRRVVAERDAASEARALAETRQREAKDAADHMLIAHAQEVAATDPIGAITLLRQLDASSSRWHDAWLATVAASTRGIPFGFRAANTILWAQIAADNRHAVTTSAGGTVAIYDLVTHTPRNLTTIPGATMCLWIGAREVLCRDATQVAIVDTEHATTKTLDIHARVMLSDRRSRAVVETADHQLLEIAGDGTVRVLATDASVGGASLDLDEVAFWHGSDLELWTPSGVLAVAHFDNDKVSRKSSAIEIRDHTLVAIVLDEMIRWRVQGDRVVEDHRWPPRQYASEAILVGSHVYSLESDEVYVDGVAVHGYKPAVLYSTPRGVAVIETDGGIVVIDDDHGKLRLGPYPTRIERVDLSPDGRFLMGISDDGEILEWDLDRLRPQGVLVQTRETPLMLSPPYVWALDSARGVVRHELGGDRTSLSLSAFYVPGGWLGVADDARWVGVREPESSQIQIYDAPVDRSGHIYHVVTQAVDVDGLVSASANGELHKWQPGTGRSYVIGRLPAAPVGFSVGGTFVVALFEDHKLSRLDVSNGARVDSQIDDDVRNIIVANNGDAWILTANGALWRWPVGASAIPFRPEHTKPARVELAERALTIERANGHVLARTSRSLIEVDVEPTRAVATDARTTRPLSAGYVAALSAHGEVSVLDLEAGARLELPASAITETLVTRGDTLMFANGVVGDSQYRYVALDLAVPHDPAALRHWLADVTNATADGGWPSP